MDIHFDFEGSRQTLAAGQQWSEPPEKLYRDSPQEWIVDLVAQVDAGGKWEELVEEAVKPRSAWLAKIMASERRNAFFKLLPKQTDFVALDVGAGFGQHSVPLAENGYVCSVEPTPERIDLLRAIAEQKGVSDKIWRINGSMLDVAFEEAFDFALCIGVLEWVGKFATDQEPRSAQLDFMRRLRRSLKPGGSVIVGIENRLGLKYLLGTRDDHIGVSHVACLDFQTASSLWKEKTGEALKVATYTIDEYEQLFEEAGFADAAFHAALPDYKLPEHIVSCYPQDELSELLVSGAYAKEHDGSDGSPLQIDAQLKSLYATLAKMKMAPQFAPSFFITLS